MIPVQELHDGCSSVTLNDSNGIMHHTLDPESKITLGSLSPERLSPNLFLSMHLDGIDERNNLNVEWVNYTDSIPSSSTTLQHMQQQHEPSISSVTGGAMTTNHNQNQYIRSTLLNPTNLIDMNNCLNLDSSISSYDDIKFFNVDHFNMETFKTDCILNMDQAIILDNKTMGESSGVLLEEPSEELEDIQSTFSIDDSMKKSMPLLDLEKPIINIDIETLVANEQHQQHQQQMQHQHLNYHQSDT